MVMSRLLQTLRSAIKWLVKPRRLLVSTLMLATAVGLSGCGPSSLASVSGAKGVLGNDLLSAKGATRDDQRKIDKTLERGITVGIWDRPKGN